MLTEAKPITMNPINSFDELVLRSTRARKAYEAIRRQPGKSRSTAVILEYIRRLNSEHEQAAGAPMIARDELFLDGDFYMDQN